MNKADLINAIVTGSGLTKSEAGRAINVTTAAITAALKKGNTVRLVGFGTFKVSKRSARIGHNPRTGAKVNVAARKYPGFSAGKALKDAVN